MSEEIIKFVAAFSRNILKHRSLRVHPEIIALASWFREKRVRKLAASYRAISEHAVLRPRGIAFHIAPANVDTIFVYSLFLSLLVGNRNVVKVSRRDSEVVSQIIKIFREIVDTDPSFAFIRNYIVVVRYDNDIAVTREISTIADLRVIWGGDESVSAVRSVPLKPTASEVAFPNRFSFSMIVADKYAQLMDKQKPNLRASTWLMSGLLVSRRARHLVYWCGLVKSTRLKISLRISRID